MSDKTLSDLQDEMEQWIFPCDCGDHRHGLVVNRGDDEIFLQIAYWPLGWRDRLRDAWHLLRYGVNRLDADSMVIRDENIGALCEMIKRAGRV